MAVKKLDLNLEREMKNATLRSKRKVLSKIMSGNWTTNIKGQGMEFIGFRQYTYGDDASKIDWNASLRAKETLVREFEEYRNVNVFLVLDVSNSMLLTSEKKMKAEYAAELTFNLALTITEGGDSLGYALITDEVIAHQPPTIGKQNIMRLMVDLQNPKNYGGPYDLKKTLSIINSMLPERTLIMIISDFIGLNKGWDRYIKMISVNSQVMGIMVRDKHDYKLPTTGIEVAVKDPYTEETLIIDTKEYQKIYEEGVRKEEEHIRKVFEKAKADFIKITTGEDMMKKLSEHFNKRMNHGQI